jgi:hypothetical protein
LIVNVFRANNHDSNHICVHFSFFIKFEEHDGRVTIY